MVLCGGEKGDSLSCVKNPTVDNLGIAEQFAKDLSDGLAKINVQVSQKAEYPNNKPDHLAQSIRKNTGASVLTVYVSIRILQFESPEVYFRSMKTVADCFRSNFIR